MQFCSSLSTCHTTTRIYPLCLLARPATYQAIVWRISGKNPWSLSPVCCQSKEALLCVTSEALFLLLFPLWRYSPVYQLLLWTMIDPFLTLLFTSRESLDKPLFLSRPEEWNVLPLGSHHVTIGMILHKFLATTEYWTKKKYYIEETQAFVLIQQFSFHFYMLLENDHFASLIWQIRTTQTMCKALHCFQMLQARASVEPLNLCSRKGI